MRSIWVYGAIAALTLAGCSTTARLYPVEGPLSAQTPPVVLQAKVNGIMGNNGSLSIRMPDGQSCEGEWSSAAGTQVSFGQASLFTQYGPVYGTGYSVTSGGGQNPGRAIAICPNGNRIDVEFVTGGGTASGFGFARDTDGNVYRVLF